MFKPSQYQQNIFDFVLTGHGSAIVQAVAGSGKTTTLIQVCGLLPASLDSIFMAFNKAIAKELDAKLPTYVKAATFHSQGFGAWMRYKGVSFRQLNVDSRKNWKVLRELLGADEAGVDGEELAQRRQLVSLYGHFVNRMVGLAKNVGMGCMIRDTIEAWEDLAAWHDVTPDSQDVSLVEAIDVARDVLKLGRTEAWHLEIDFDDMLYLPLFFNARFKRHDWVFIDEAQDTNGVQLELIKRMLKDNGRLIAIGDRGQAIYGFRGADATAMDNMKQDFECAELPLSVCYRCATSIVAAAQEYVPHIEAHADAPEGLVRWWSDDDDPWQDALTKGDVVLCRNNAPLVTTAYRLIAQGIGCHVEGRDIGKGLIMLIEKMRAKGIDQLEAKLAKYAEREITKLAAKDLDALIGALADKLDCMAVLISHLNENERTVPKLVKRIETMFADSDDVDRITLSSLHKSKGREWDRVFILGRDKYMPSKFAKQDWMMVQEDNLAYVGYTRAALELYFIPAEAA